MSSAPHPRIHSCKLLAAAVLLVMWITVGLRIVYLDQRSFSFDEASSWRTAELPLDKLLDSLSQSTHVPLYYPLLNVWMGVWGASPLAVRGFSAVLGLLTVFGVGVPALTLKNCVGSIRPDQDFEYMLTNTEHCPEREWFAVFCASLCGFNAFQVLSSVEARMYSLGSLLSVLTTLATLRVADAPEQRRHWIALVLLTVLSLYTHHFLALTAGIQALWLLWMVRQTGFRQWLMSVIAVGVLWIPGLWLWAIQFNRIQTDFWIQPMTWWSLPETALDFFVAPPPGRRWEFHAAGLSVLVIIAILMFRLLRRHMSSELCLLWMQAVIPLVLIALVSQRTPLWESRYFRFAHISLLICLASSLWSLSRRPFLRHVICLMAVIASLAASIAFWNLREIPNRQAVRGAMQWIQQFDKVGSATVVVTSPMHFIVARYYAQQQNWPEERVKLWTGEDRKPGAAVHLIRRTDWWEPDSSEIWLMSAGCLPNSFRGRPIPPGYRFPSDTWLSEWAAVVAYVDDVAN